ncbi:hypothetical protein HMPREF9997_00627 [Corynebacterium durum F0235]|uniref:Uncharacterized protein n=1 Tax=Corynebacterium durum F0235 TaxID=1035195 RepID=L1MJZ2_9CORY|nr:hypothetical protein HMPREF9997_00627 [Corynebacterium durum F0235]
MHYMCGRRDSLRLYVIHHQLKITLTHSVPFLRIIFKPPPVCHAVAKLLFRIDASSWGYI